MKVVIAPQGFKETLSALEVANAIEEGILSIIPTAETIVCPVADGGDGTLEVLLNSLGGETKNLFVSGPRGDKLSSSWGLSKGGKLAIIEAASSIGIANLPVKERNPMLTTSYGVGETIKAALDEGCRNFIIGIGGTSTNDGGAGMAQALGARFLDGVGEELPWGGEALLDLASIDMRNFDPRVEESEFLIACDVLNPLTGKEGATAVFGPQKGATSEMVAKLEASLFHYSRVIKRDLGVLINAKSWAGAGGGLGGGCHAFLKGELKSGIEVVLSSIGFSKKLEGVDLVITGEGCLDNQTAYFKAPMGVAKKSEELGIPVVAIVGAIGEGYEEVFDLGIKAVAATPASYINDVFGSVAMATKEALRWVTLPLEIK